MVDRELDKLATQLKSTTLSKENFKVPGGKSDESSCPGIDLIFQGLRDTKLKRKSLKVLEQSLKANPLETQQCLMQRITAKVDNEEKYILLKQILDLLDGPPMIKQSLMTGLQEICSLAMHSITKASNDIKEGGNLQDVGKEILDSELFNALRICVSIFQNYGNHLLNNIVGNATNHSDQTWETAWIQFLITELLVILGGRAFQKELLSLAGIALAHVVNNLPSVNESLHLANVICGIAEIGRERAEVYIRKSKVEIRSSHLEDVSPLREIMAYNGLLSVCSPKILLTSVTAEQKGETVLMQAFAVICEMCSKSLHAAVKYSSFQVLNTWMECISRITMPIYHEIAENSQPLFQESSTFCRRLLDLIWDNRESMIDGVSKFVLSIFRRLIELHVYELIALGIQPQHSRLFYIIATKLLKDPWYMKGRYSLLCELLPHYDSYKILQLHPSLQLEICKCFSTSTLQSVANECYRGIIVNAKSDTTTCEKLWTAEYWTSVWMDLTLSLLKDQNLRAVHNTVLYLIPTTLQLVNGIFERIRDAILKELRDLNKSIERSPSEETSTRSKLLFGYCSVVKIARKTGLAFLVDIDTDILKESLRHVNDDVRAAAISVLCYNNKTTEPITNFEEDLIWEFLPVNLNCASSSFRQSFFVSLKVFLARIRDSSVMMLRNYTKEAKRVRNNKQESFQLPERLQASVELVEKIVSLSLQSLFPGACFQRRKTGLQILYSVLETFSSPNDAVKKGRTVESLKSLTDWVYENGRWNFITLQNLKVIVSCLEDQHDEIREVAMTITNWFQFETMKIDDHEQEQFCMGVVTRVSALMSSPKIRDAESAAILMEFVAKRFTKKDDFSLRRSDSDFTTRLSPHEISNLNIAEIVMYLTNKMHDEAKESQNDILHSAVFSPVFGYTLAARRCFCALIQIIRRQPTENVSSNVEYLAVLTKRIVQTCIFVIRTALSLFSKKKEDAQGASPSFADINESLGRTLSCCQSFPELKNSIGYQHCLELLSSFCWLNVKAASLFLGDVGKVLSLDSLNATQKKAVISDELISNVGKIFKETLINCRHKGVIENSCTGFQIFCKSLSSSSSSRMNILCNWLDETIEACDRNDLSSSVTKRSAGLPMFFQSIISSCVSSPTFNLGKYIQWLIEIAKRPVPVAEKMQSDLPQVQAMNILRGIYRDSSVGTEVLQFAEDGLMLAVEGFSSTSWAIRNAAQILLGALVPRMLGQRITQADKSYHNSVSPEQFFSRYPALEHFFLKYLKMGVDRRNQVKLLPALVPILTLLSKLRPFENERFSPLFSSLLDNLLSSYVVTVRNLAASSLVVFLSRDLADSFAGQTILKIINKSCSCNYRHGLLLVVKKLLTVCDDDPELLHVALTKGIWPNLDALARLNHGKCTEYLSRSAVFEIISIIISYLTKIPSDVSFLYQDHLFKIMKQQAHHLRSTDCNSHQEQIGYYLCLKRFAKASVDLVICMQSSSINQASEFIECLLTTHRDQFEVELFLELTYYLENGGFINDKLKIRLCRTLMQRIISQDKENLVLYSNCWCALGVDFETLETNEEILSGFLRTANEILCSESSHRKLAAFLPFVGMLVRPFCQRHRPSLMADFMRLLLLWSEKVFLSSAACEREILRISSLNAVRASIECIILLYCKETSAESSNEGSMQLICTRIILASLRLVQDEDEDIRKEACFIANKLNLAMHDNNRSVSFPMQTNLAMQSIFIFVSNKLWSNMELMKEFFAILAELCSSECCIFDTGTQRSLLLFEQEGSNLFAEELIFASEIIKCLRDCCGNISMNEKALTDDFSKEFQLILDQAAKNNMQQLQILTDYIENSSIDELNHGFLANPKTYVTVYICIGLSGLLHMYHDSADSDKATRLKLLNILDEGNVYDLTIKTEIRRTLETIMHKRN